MNYVITASFDNRYCKYYTEELVVNDKKIKKSPILELIKKCLDNFLRKTNQKYKPVYVIIYRSGISDNLKKKVYKHEVKPLINFFSGKGDNCFRPNYTAKISFFIVNIRTNAKFFEIDNNQYKNPPAGTVIDTQIIYPGAYEFYLQPQYVNQGAATPTHFHCIYDDTSFELEIMENITNKLCYYYWNWNGAIREPAPLKFARVANTFNSKNIQNTVRNSLKDKLYYI